MYLNDMESYEMKSSEWTVENFVQWCPFMNANRFRIIIEWTLLMTVNDREMEYIERIYIGL